EHHHLLRPAIGSHNVRSIAHALALADAHNLPPRSIEFQLLYGMADPIKTALVGMGQRVRVYTPYGQLLPGMAYLVRRLLENTANQSFLRAGFVEHVPEEQLLMNPQRTEDREQKTEDREQRTEHDSRASLSSVLCSLSSGFRNEPVTDFSREANQQKMREALGAVAKQLGVTGPLIIDGKGVATTK